MAHTNVQLVSGNLTTGQASPTFFIDRVNDTVGIGGVPDITGDTSSNVLQVSGNMFATKYHGDGSNITGLYDSKWLEYSGDTSKIYYNGGNVGIGVDNPATKLAVDGTVTATTFSGALSGNSATATTASSCSGNSATATTASSCSGNSATATTATTATNVDGSGTVVAYTGTFSGSIEAGKDTDTNSYLGRAKIGPIGYGDYAGFAHFDTAIADYALLQDSAGKTLLNCNSDQNISFLSGNSTKMKILGSGIVGIGTSSPTAKLHVNGFGTVSVGSAERTYFNYSGGTSLSGDAQSSGGVHGGHLTNNTSPWSSASIYATTHILTSGYFVAVSGTLGASDKRIKKDIIDIDDGSALETLRLLKPKQYKYKDDIMRGSEPVWGFIAQEVRETLPYATQIRTDTLPNIYEMATVSNSNVITLTTFNTSNLVSNTSTISVYDIENRKHSVSIKEIIDDHTIRVEEDLNEMIGSVDETGNIVTVNKLFIYGEDVDDFIYLKKEAIFTIATAALQEVDRQLQVEKARNDALEARILALENK